MKLNPYALTQSPFKEAATEQRHCEYCLLTSKQVAKLHEKAMVIFLDLDGVLRRCLTNWLEPQMLFGEKSAYTKLEKSVAQLYHLDDDPVFFLMKLLSQMMRLNKKVGIVLSSHWRTEAKTHELKQLMGHQPFSPYFIGKTKTIDDGTDRGIEIKQWQESHQLGPFLILDDEEKSIPSYFNAQHFFKVNHLTGLSQKELDLIAQAFHLSHPSTFRHCEDCLLRTDQLEKIQHKAVGILLDLPHALREQWNWSTFEALSEEEFPYIGLKKVETYRRHFKTSSVETLNSLIEEIKGKNLFPCIIIKWMAHGSEVLPYDQAAQKAFQNEAFSSHIIAFNQHDERKLTTWLSAHRLAKTIAVGSFYSLNSSDSLLCIEKPLNPSHVEEVRNFLDRQE